MGLPACQAQHTLPERPTPWVRAASAGACAAHPTSPARPADSQRPGWRSAPIPRGRGCPPALASPGSGGRQVAGLLEGRGMPASCCSPSAALTSLSSQPQLGRLPDRRPPGSRRRGGPSNTHCLTFCTSGRARPPCKSSRRRAEAGGRVRAGRLPGHPRPPPP